MNFNTVTHFFLLIALLSCARNSEPKVSEQEIRDTEEALIGANRLLIKKDKEKIMKYIQQHKLSLTQTETGLWYGILEPGTGKQVTKNELITIEYQVSLLDGTLCYDSDSLGIKQFRMGSGGVESGLEEGLLLLKEGSKAIFIMPPHLAHGLTGDGNRIPARSIIVYHVEVERTDP